MVWQLIILFHCSFLQVTINCFYVFWFDLMEVMFCQYECGHEPKHTTKMPTTWGQSIMIVWPTFPSIGFTLGLMWWKSPFTIRFTFESIGILLMVHVTQGPHHTCQCMFHACPTLNFIWTQLKLGYIVKQIYDKDKEIWWARVNLGQWMIWIDLLRFQNIACLDRKHKRGTWHLHKNPLALFVHLWVLLNILMMFFNF
jgi:hypothetical protein